MAEVVIDIKAVDNFSGVLSNFGSIVTGVESAINLASRAFQAFTDVAMQGLDAVASYERLTLALTTLNAAQLLQAGVAENMAAAMEVSAVKAEELASWMQELAIHSPFTLEGVAQAFRLAMAYGFSADEAQRLTQALIDFSAGTGASEYNMQRIALALGQISTIGKLTGQDMMQLTQAGLPVAQILADAFGVTTAQIIEMRTDGLLPAQEVIEALTVWIETNFVGAADAFSSSWAGLQSTFSDIRQMGLRELFTGVLEAIQPLTIEISAFLQGAGMELAGQIGNIAGEFVRNNVAIQTATEFLQLFNERVSEGTPLLDALFLSLEDVGLEEFSTRLQEFITTGETEGWTQAFKDLFTDVFGGIDLVDSIQTLADNAATALGEADWSGVEQKLSEIFSNATKNSLSGLASIVDDVDWGPFGTALARAIGQTLAGVFGGIGEGFWSFVATELFNDESVDIFFESARIGAGRLGEILLAVIFPPSLFVNFRDKFREIGIGIAEGLASGIDSALRSIGLVDFANWTLEHIVNPVKRILGISSPSTVFFNIGRDLVQGLMNGIRSMFGSLDSTIAEMGSRILGGATSGTGAVAGGIGGSLLSNWLNNILGDTTTGTIGGRTGPSQNGILSGTVTNNYNFYAPVYMTGVGPEGTYDCAPNPTITSTSGGMTGGRIVAR